MDFVIFGSKFSLILKEGFKLLYANHKQNSLTQTTLITLCHKFFWLVKNDLA